MMERIWQILKILFRIYQYACYSLVFLILTPVIALYMFDLTLYLFRLMSYFIRFQVYLIRNRCLPDTRSLYKPRETYPWKEKEHHVEEEECVSSNTSILSAFRDSKESLLDDNGSMSSNYSLVSLSQNKPRRISSSRNGSIIALDPSQVSFLAAHADIAKMRRNRNPDVDVSLDRYANHRLAETL